MRRRLLRREIAHLLFALFLGFLPAFPQRILCTTAAAHCAIERTDAACCGIRAAAVNAAMAPAFTDQCGTSCVDTAEETILISSHHAQVKPAATLPHGVFWQPNCRSRAPSPAFASVFGYGASPPRIANLRSTVVLTC